MMVLSVLIILGRLIGYVVVMNNDTIVLIIGLFSCLSIIFLLIDIITYLRYR